MLGAAEAGWLSYRIEHAYWEQDGHPDSDIDIAALIGSLWCAILKRSPEQEKCSLRREAVEQLLISCSFLAKYEVESQAARVRKVIEELGGAAKPQPTATSPRPHMAQAFHQMLNGDYETAWRTYEQAVEASIRDKDPFSSWLAAFGRYDAYRRATDLARRSTTSTDEREARQRILKEYARSLKKHTSHPDVVRWKDLAERRMSEVRKQALDEQRESAQDRLFERRRMSFSTVLHFGWRIFRDLQCRDAPPGLQERYLRPLLDHPGFGADVDRALSLRLLFAIDKTRAWIEEAIESGPQSVEEAKVRHNQLVAAWHRAWAETDTPQSTIVACLDAMEPLLEVLDLEHAGLPLELLQRASKLPEEVHNHRSWHFIGNDLARAWRQYASNHRDEVALNAFLGFARGAVQYRAIEELGYRMGRLPWYAWLVLRMMTAEEMVRILCGGIEKRAVLRGASQGWITGYAEALLNVVGRARDVGDELSGESWDLVADWCNIALKSNVKESHDLDGMGPILNLLAIQASERGGRGRDDLWREVESRALQELRQAWPDDVTGIPVTRALSVMWCLAIIMPAPGALDEWGSFADRAWQKLNGNWEKVKAHIESNPTELPKLGWFLATIVEVDFRGRRMQAAAKLLDAWDISSSVQYAARRILADRYWDETQWATLVDKLRRGIGGARGERSASWRIAVSSLLRDAVRDGSPLPTDLRFLVEHVALLVSNEVAIVANHAAYTVVFYAETCTDEDADVRMVQDMVSTLTSIAADPRLPVRHAAAYAAGRLPRTAKSRLIRDCASRIREAIEKETYLILQRQTRLGEAEARAKLQRERAPAQT